MSDSDQNITVEIDEIHIADQEPVSEPIPEPVSEPVSEPILSVEVTTADAPSCDTGVTDTPSVALPSFNVPRIIPKYVFIVPYRDREQQLSFFKKHMSFVLEDINPNDYKTVFIHQCDSRSFNRGAMKNIGFLYVKNEYPDNYKNITLVFNDIDTMPYTKNFFNYDTNHGIVKHFYGFKYALGGIVSIKAADFERINGFPNFWAWGFEDNLLQKRVLNSHMFIDRSSFYPLMDKNIFQMKDGLDRLVNREEFNKYLDLTKEGISDIQSLNFEYDATTNFVNVKQFITGTEDIQSKSVPYNLTSGNKPFSTPVRGRRGRAAMGMRF